METELNSFDQEVQANPTCPKCPDLPKCPIPVCKMECPTNNYYRSYSSNPYFDNFTLLYYILTSTYFIFKSFSSIYRFLKVRFFPPTSVTLNLPVQDPNSVPLSYSPSQNPSETSFHSA